MGGAVLFDLDNTLLDRTAAYRRWAEWFAGSRGWDDEEVTWLVDADGDGHVPRPELFARVRDRHHLREPVDVLVESYERDYPAFIEPDDAVCRALEGLRADGWRLAIVTNGHALQRVKIERAGLASLVDGCCVSAELGSWKPDPRIFEQALAACGATDGATGERWMVGDSAEHDMVGAHALGLLTVWIHRGRPWPLDDFGPVHRALDVPEAVAVIRAGRSST